MRCMMCEGLSLSHICKRCQDIHLSPSVKQRKILGKIPVYSFYKYDEVEPLLLTKHSDLGHYIYTLLARKAFEPFAQEFTCDSPVAVIGIDEHVGHGYSHTALLSKALRSTMLTPRHNILRATSNTTYSGQSYQFRLLHPRRFNVKPFPEEDVILVDDIVTTGLTLTQAAEAMHKEGKNVLACLTLANADEKC